MRTFIEKPIYKLGIDIHGVLDTYPSFFVEQAQHVLKNGGEVHIITGIPCDNKVMEELLSYNDGKKYWTHYFSIVEYLKSKGEKYTLDERGRYWFDIEVWDRVKADYCEKESIDLHYDDSPEYARHFKTPIMLFMPNPTVWRPPNLFEKVVVK